MNTYVILALLAFTVMGCYGLTAERPEDHAKPEVYYPEPQDHNYHPEHHIDEPYARADTPDTQYGPTHQEYNRIERDYADEHPEYQFSPKHHQCKQHKPIVCKPGFGLDPARLASYLKGAYIVPTCEKCKAGTTSPGGPFAVCGAIDIVVPQDRGYLLVCPAGSFMSAVTVKANDPSDKAVNQIGPIVCKDFVSGVETQVAGTAGGSSACCSANVPANDITSAAGFKTATIRVGYWMDAVQFTDANGVASAMYGGPGGTEISYSCPKGSLISGLMGSILGATCENFPSCNYLDSMLLLCTAKPVARF